MKWKLLVAWVVLAGGGLAVYWFGQASGTPGVGRSAASGSRAQMVEPLRRVIDKLRPLHRELGEPEPGDWLESHEESGQTFQEYLDCDPVLPDGERRVIYLQPIGEFSKKQKEMVTLTADYVGRYFNLEVRVLPDKTLVDIPDRARRRHPTWGMKQLLSTYFLDEVLAPALPDDAAALMALTAMDLWPGEGWNFVFGQASLRKRVGIWSIYRNGDPDASDADFRLCLLRTIATATHELGHMFTMSHCTAYECNMGGSNSREESDEGPLALCPECLAKVSWATTTDPIKRYEILLDFCRQHGLTTEAEFFEKSLDSLRSE